ncbi:cytidine deaminase [Synechococcus sp. MU1642]|uniref:cytidine deaminase n=1 Tax=Synechococcus sp. MU1642 TaxID=2508348 RepID=UPI00351D4506
MCARQAAKRAHCPYSNLHVGAAVRCADGSVIDGCNVENASYRLSICAKRVALFTAISQGKRLIELAVSCIDATGDAAASRIPHAVRRLPSGDAGTAAKQGRGEHRWCGNKAT